ncbi:helix-turn-helix domain-containing protein [Flavobacterium ardleyense]|uniref:Helix-turn-helix domain-containing protein n=1 Tax=Flavobacterium ardleyense TaxID=2038737 RepID=A0ABW5ZAM2_9FLAO
MTLAILTKEDLQEFKTELLADIMKIVKADDNTTLKKWLKSKEVVKLLNISSGTLQTLRSNGILTFSKVGGTYYYANEDIEKLMNSTKKAANLNLFR